MVLSGHWRSESLRGGKLLYFLEGSLSLRRATVSFLHFEAVVREGRVYIGILGREWR